MNSTFFSSLESEIAIQAQASGASRGQKHAPGMSSFLAIFRFETGLCQYLPLLDTYHPSIYKYNISNADLLTEPNPQIGCKSLIAPCNNGLRHRLIQDGRYDTAMNYPLKTLPSCGRDPLGRCAAAMRLESKMHSLRALIAAHEACRI